MNAAIHFLPCEREIFAKREVIIPSKWASKKIIVQDGLYKGSPMRMDVAPYMPGILDMYAKRGVQEIIVCGSLQIGKTLILYACMGWAMDYRPGTKMLAMPTKDTRDRVKKEKLLPLMKGSPFLRKQMAKDLTDVIQLKNGQNIWLASAESPSQRASITVQDLFLDEEDLYADSGNASAVDDFKGRTRSLGARAKILRVSQPKGDSTSSIWQGLTKQTDTLFCYEVKCPSCLQYHLPDIVYLHAEEEDPLTIRRKKLARYICPVCGYAWSDHIRDIAVQGGRWMPYTYTDERGFITAQAVDYARAVGFHVPALLARSVSLSDILAKRILAEGGTEKDKQQFANDELGLPYSPVALITDSQRILDLREAWLPPRTAPHGTVAITCGIDVQKRGFWYLVKAWMPSMASYVIDYGSLNTWDDVYSLVFDTCYPVLGPHDDAESGFTSGEVMPIWRGLMDTGGTDGDGVYTRTEEVYLWLRAHGGGALHASKGASRSQVQAVKRTIRERMPKNGRPIPGGLPLYLLDTNQLKTLAMSRLINAEST